MLKGFMTMQHNIFMCKLLVVEWSLGIVFVLLTFYGWRRPWPPSEYEPIVPSAVVGFFCVADARENGVPGNRYFSARWLK